MTSGEDNRAFHYAVISSIALHGVLLFGLSAPKFAATPVFTPPPILARLIELAEEKPLPAVPPAAPQVEPARRTAEPVKPKAREKPRASAPVQKSKVQEPPTAAAEAATESAARSVEAPAVPAPAVEAIEPASPPVMVRVDPLPSPAPVPSAPPSAAQPDLGSLAQYRVQLIAAAKKHKRYPRIARENHWTGDVVVRMVIGPDGSLASVGVKKSSGYSVLDQEAVEMFKKAKAAVPIPPVLRGQEFAVDELRATYELTDQDSG